MRYWSLACVMPSDKGWCLVDRLHTELSPWLKIHYATCALNFNHTNHLKRLDLNKNFCVRYSADLQRIICLYQRCTAVTNDAAPAASASNKDYRFLIENNYFILLFSPMDSASAILPPFYSPSSSSSPLMSSSFHHLSPFVVTGRTPILLHRKEGASK